MSGAAARTGDLRYKEKEIYVNNEEMRTLIK